MYSSNRKLVLKRTPLNKHKRTISAVSKASRESKEAKPSKKITAHESPTTEDDLDWVDTTFDFYDILSRMPYFNTGKLEDDLGKACNSLKRLKTLVKVDFAVDVLEEMEGAYNMVKTVRSNPNAIGVCFSSLAKSHYERLGITDSLKYESNENSLNNALRRHVQTEYDMELAQFWIENEMFVSVMVKGILNRVGYGPEATSRMLIDQLILKAMEFIDQKNSIMSTVMYPELQLGTKRKPVEVKSGKYITYLTGSTDYVLLGHWM